MEKLITCSRVLYNKDISDKMEEITSLKRNIRFYETPQIEYSNLEEWETKKKEAYQIIKNGLNEWIVEDNLEYQHMYYWGLTPKQIINIPKYIEQALKIITKENNKEWIINISHDIINGIEGFLNAFIKTGIWDLIHSPELGPETMSNLIYNYIIWKLDDRILENVAIFTCEMCGKKDTYINDDNICFECEEKNI